MCKRNYTPLGLGFAAVTALHKHSGRTSYGQKGRVGNHRACSKTLLALRSPHASGHYGRPSLIHNFTHRYELKTSPRSGHEDGRVRLLR